MCCRATGSLPEHRAGSTVAASVIFNALAKSPDRYPIPRPLVPVLTRGYNPLGHLEPRSVLPHPEIVILLLWFENEERSEDSSRARSGIASGTRSSSRAGTLTPDRMRGPRGRSSAGATGRHPCLLLAEGNVEPPSGRFSRVFSAMARLHREDFYATSRAMY